MSVTHLAAIAPSLPADGSGQGVRAYLASLSSGPSRTSMRSALDQVARILTGSDDVDASRVPWNRLRYEHMQALRLHLADAYAPATANKMLAAVRGVLCNAWQVGTMDTDEYSRAMAVKSVRGSRLPAGRALNSGEIRALFSVCSADRNPAGSRDAAAFAMLFGAGFAAAKPSACIWTTTTRNRERSPSTARATGSDWCMPPVEERKRLRPGWQTAAGGKARCLHP